MMSLCEHNDFSPVVISYEYLYERMKLSFSEQFDLYGKY